MYKILYKLLLPIIVISIFTGCTIEINENAKHVKMYEIRAVDNYSQNNEKKMRWFIDAPEALTNEQRVYTALEAARDCKKKTSAVECTIHQIATQNAYEYGDLFYSILVYDKNNKTKVEVSDIKLTKNQYNIGYYYIKLRTKYKDAKPEELKKEFYKVMVDKLKIPENELKLPRIERKEFLVK